MEVDGRENHYFEWKLSNHLMQKSKDARHRAVFASPLFNAIGGEWYLIIYPNGRKTKGIASLDIVCLSIESDEKEMDVSYYVDISALGYCQINIDGNAVKEGDMIACDSPFEFSDIRNQSEIAIGVKLWRVESMDRYEARLISDSYSVTNTLPKEWKECPMSQEHQITRFLTLLGLTKYAETFKENEFEAMGDIEDLCNEDLKDMGIKALKSRKMIMK
eukprot:730381_1